MKKETMEKQEYKFFLLRVSVLPFYFKICFKTLSIQACTWLENYVRLYEMFAGGQSHD